HVFEGDAFDGQRQQRRATAGDDANDQVMLIGLFDEFDYRPRGFHTGYIGYRMTGFADLDPTGGCTVAIPNRDAADDGESFLQDVFDCRGHWRRRLASPDHDDRTEVA